MSTNIPKTSARFETTPVSNISSGATSFSLATATDIYGNALSGLYGFSIDEGQSTQEFFIASVSGTTVSSIQAMTSGSDPLSSMATGLQQPHRKSAVVKITDYPLLAYLREVINGNTNYTFDNILSYTSGPTFTVANQIITKAYADALAIAGAPNASMIQKGIVQEATAAQINAGTATGSTGAILGITPDQLALTNLALAAAGNNTSIPVGSGNKFATQTGLQNKAETYAVSTGSANAYVLTLSPVPVAYVAGQEFEFTANFASTASATLNVNSLGAKTIKKLDGATNLVSGDIANGLTVKVKYDGANFIMMNPVANPPLLNSVPAWVEEGALTWAAETTDKTLTLANAGKDIYMAVIKLNAGSAATNMQLNGVTGSSYDYCSLASTTISNTTSQSSFLIANSASSIIGVLYITGKHSSGVKSVTGTISTAALTTARFFTGGELSSDSNNLSTIKILVNTGSTTGTVHVYSLNL